MGLRDWLGFKSAPSVSFNTESYRHEMTNIDVSHVLDQSAEDLWRKQPYLRTVVTFLARNVAQLGLHTFVRAADGDRERVRDTPLAMLLDRPNKSTTAYELVHALVADLALYDRAYWIVSESVDAPSGFVLRALPPAWVQNTYGGDAFEPDGYVVQPPKGGQLKIPSDQMIVFHGWNPTDPRAGSSPVQALKAILAEQMHAQAHRQQVWERGGRVGSVLTRPAAAPDWSPEARKRFSDDWRSKWTGDDGPKAGGTPILEDGMELKSSRFSAHEEEYIEAAKLALTTVASVYHVNPTMIGLLDNANYSNVREFRRMLYGDTLGPILAMIEARLNAFLVPRLGEPAGTFVEFNIGEKLQGSFEEQAAVMSTLVGRPIMTGDEGRAKFNLPALGGDMAGTATPLNVLIGGQASPRDSGSQNVEGSSSGVVALKAGGSVSFKARPPQSHETKTAEVLKAFFARQRKSVLSALGAKAGEDWWDADRWDGELSDDLYALALQTSKHVSAEVLDSLGFDPDVYDEKRTEKFLKAVASSRARMVNETTREQVKAALESEDESPADVFDRAEDNRSVEASAALVTTFATFATTEAAKQAAGDRATKTWMTTSRNPRPEHAAMAGETVGIEDTFSNGAAWPGDPVLGAAGVAGCQCDVSIEIT